MGTWTAGGQGDGRRRGALYGAVPVALRMQSQQIASMPTSITIRDVPDDVRDELASRAALAGQSLQEHLRGELIALARKPTVHTLIERIRKRKEATGGTLSREQILAFRDEDRR